MKTIIARHDFSAPKWMAILLITISILFSCSPNDGNKKNSSIQGVWEYTGDNVLHDIRGMSFFTENHFAFVVNFKSEPSDGEYSVLAHSGTYDLQDSIVTATIIYSANPAITGQKLRWIHKTDGSTATYEILNANGEVVESGKVRKLE